MIEWRPIKNYGNYEISNTGKIINLKRSKVLIESVSVYGYCLVTLCQNNIRVSKRVHRLVAQAFIPNPEGKPQINHIDGNKLHNHTTNLEWTTPQENMDHAYETKLNTSIGEGHGCVVLTENDVRNIRDSYSKSTVSQAELGRSYGVSRNQIHRIVHRKAWKHI